MMLEELIADELEMQASSRQQAAAEEQQTQRLRQQQRDELIDDLVSLLCYSSTCFTASELYLGKFLIL